MCAFVWRKSFPAFAALVTGKVVEKVTCENKYEIKGAKEIGGKRAVCPEDAVFNKESFLANQGKEAFPL